MYNLMKIVSIIIRQFYVPNPFEPREDAVILNWIAEPIMHLVTFSVVGMFYDRGSAPAVGSFLYLLFYFIHTGLLMLMGYFQWTRIAIIIVVIMYIGVLCIVKGIVNSIRFF